MCTSVNGLFSNGYVPNNFPNLKQRSHSEDMVAYGGNLSSNLLVEAYAKGIFPWYNEEPIRWYSPRIRMVFLPNTFKVGNSFAKFLRKKKDWHIKIDRNFQKIIENCSFIPRKSGEGTWINADMREAYMQLHLQGICHSIEVWESEATPQTKDNNKKTVNVPQQLIGGLYGLSLGRAFFGESMFSKKPNASKVAIFFLQTLLFAKNFEFIDCQIPSSHLENLGAEQITREKFLDILESSNKKETSIGGWQNWEPSPGSFRA